MKILIVCSGNVPNFNFKIHRAFIYEQIESIKKLYNIDYETFFIKGKGLFGYLKNFPSLLKKNKKFKPDLIHAHFGLSALLANLQRKTPVVTTLHGCDLNSKKNRKFSLTARFLSKSTIFVSPKMYNGIKRNNDFIIPCGVNLDKFVPLNKKDCRKKLNLDLNKIYVLFSSSFDIPVKNFVLAKEAINKINNCEIEIIELKNKTRNEVNLLLNATDLLLLTSISEGSPQIIKEAMACNCPIVATDVGDIKEIISGTDGCYICSFDPNDVAEKIKMALEFVRTKGRTNGRVNIKNFDNHLIAQKIYYVYEKVLNFN